MQENIYLLIAFLAFSHGQLSSENYRQKLYNIKNEAYNQTNNLLSWNATYQQPHSRQPRDSDGRFKCVESGFYANVKDCTQYYECIKEGNNRQSKFRQLVHKCDFGKVFSHANGGTCTQPQESGRVECVNYRWLKKRDKSEQNGIEDNTSEETPESTLLGVTVELANSKKICQREGFIPHPTNKNKYYSCLPTRRRSGEFIRYEFVCNGGATWERTKQKCSYRLIIESDDSEETVSSSSEENTKKPKKKKDSQKIEKPTKKENNKNHSKNGKNKKNNSKESKEEKRNHKNDKKKDNHHKKDNKGKHNHKQKDKNSNESSNSDSSSNSSEENHTKKKKKKQKKKKKKNEKGRGNKSKHVCPSNKNKKKKKKKKQKKKKIKKKKKNKKKKKKRK